jgi:NTP pyrophosphatase (non-canonical NTP hydrolase)
MSNKKIDKPGYHLVEIKKGKLGEISKIQEEVDELVDAENQNSKIMIGVELSDLYGAIQAYASKHGYTMDDLKNMSEITQRVFVNGRRK